MSTDNEPVVDYGGYTALVSGQRCYYFNPAKTLVYSEDIYRSLRVQRRYHGHLDVPVLAHLALCVVLAKHWLKKRDHPEEALYIAACAAHDLHEAYFPDLPRPLKVLVPGWAEHEERWEAHVHTRLGLPWPRPRDLDVFVRKVDHRVVAIETDVWGHPHAATEFWPRHGGPPSPAEHDLGVVIKGMADTARWAKVVDAIRGAVPGSLIEVPLNWLPSEMP